MSDLGPEFDRWAEHVRKTLVPMLRGSKAFLSITPAKPDDVDAKFAVELGLAVMMDKPILAIVHRGAPIPAKLARVVDRFIEMDLNTRDGLSKLPDIIKEVLRDFDATR